MSRKLLFNQGRATTCRARRPLLVEALAVRLAAHDAEIAPHYAWPILESDGTLAGIITRGDLVRATGRGDDPRRTILEAGSRAPIVAYPDELLEEAVDKMIRHGVGRLPVVARRSPGRLLGLSAEKGSRRRGRS
jgi:CIC family chloride channel protein